LLLDLIQKKKNGLSFSLRQPTFVGTMASFYNSLNQWTSSALSQVTSAFKTYPVAAGAGVAVATLAGLKWVRTTD